MLTKPEEPRIPLPKGWQGCVKSAVLHAIALAHYSIVYARAWAADSIMHGCDSRRKTIGSTKNVACCAKNSASRIPAWRKSRLSAGRITAPMSAWRSSSLHYART